SREHHRPAALGRTAREPDRPGQPAAVRAARRHPAAAGGEGDAGARHRRIGPAGRCRAAHPPSALPRGTQAQPGADGREDRATRFRPRPPLSHHQRLPGLQGMSAVAVRFAPSPTGRLHVGNARGALLNWLFARKAGGSFLLRLDDTDTGRSTEEFARGIEDDLRWLGLDWDRFAKQSDRFALYAEAAEKLRKSGRLYPAYETPEELELRRKIQLSQRRPPVYDRAALKLTDADRAKLEAEGRRPVWRFKLEHNRTAWVDLIHGHVEIDMASLSDPVLLRSDGYPLYTLSSVVDDGDLGITHVIRGEDHVTNTAAQIQLFEALGYAVPTFGHFSLLLDAEGGGLSKRLGSLSLADLRAQGIEPMALNSLLARLGSADPVEPKQSLQELVAGFDLT